MLIEWLLKYEYIVNIKMVHRAKHINKNNFLHCNIKLFWPLLTSYFFSHPPYYWTPSIRGSMFFHPPYYFAHPILESMVDPYVEHSQ